MALQQAGKARRPPREIAEGLAAAAVALDGVASASVAGPGFVNLVLDDSWFVAALAGVLGDGDFLQAASALWTAARYAIPALFVISNNRGNLTDVAHQETMARQRDRPAENAAIGQLIDEPAVDLCGIARAQGVAAAGPVAKFGDLLPALEAALSVVENGQPYLLDVLVMR